MKPTSVHQRVTNQFSATASSYARSAVHSNLRELSDLVSLLEPRPSDEAIDVATGAGHMALALAPHVAKVIAFDLTRPMLEQTLATARMRDLPNVLGVQGAAESLPFGDESFDIYTVRLAPHHFADLRASTREAARVLRPDGRYLVVDTTAPEDDSLDRQLNEIELLRDPSHIRNYRVTEWQKMLAEAGLVIETKIEGRCGVLEFDDWTRRQNVPADRKAILRKRFLSASLELREVMQVVELDQTFEFTLPQVILLAKKLGCP